MRTEADDAAGTGHVLCRVCNKGCPMIAEVRDGRLAAVRGNKDNELFAGYTCVKGRALPAFVNGPVGSCAHSDGCRTASSRFRWRPRWTRSPPGCRRSWTPAARGRSPPTTERSSKRAAGALMRAFSAAIGSDMKFGASSLDKPGRSIAWAMLGKWQAPPTGFASPGVVLMLGINPLVNGLGGIPAGHPGHWLGERLDAGTELIVVDPRRSDIAKRATLFLQPRPGHDIPILAAMLNVILTERLHDDRFTTQNVRNLEALRSAVSAFDPREVAARSGLDPADLERAARVFARAGRGYAVAGTGPHMAGQGTLSNTSRLASTPCAATGCGQARSCRPSACSARRPSRARRRTTRRRPTGSAPGLGSADWG